MQEKKRKVVLVGWGVSDERDYNKNQEKLSAGVSGVWGMNAKEVAVSDGGV